MKIVDRKTFLELPEGTLFSKYKPCVFGDICIKGANAGTNDFYVQQIVDAIKHNSSDDFFESLENAQKTGASISMDFDYEGRDGCFDEDQLFAVWEKADVDALNARLERVAVR